jgi:hypothetical protein
MELNHKFSLYLALTWIVTWKIRANNLVLPSSHGNQYGTATCQVLHPTTIDRRTATAATHGKFPFQRQYHQTTTKMPGVSVRDVDAQKFIEAYAAFLKRQGKLPVPGMRPMILRLGIGDNWS